MRIAVTLAKDSQSKWHVLATPDVSIDEQKQLFKQLRIADGVSEAGKKPVQFLQGLLLTSTGQVKRDKWSPERTARRKANEAAAEAQAKAKAAAQPQA